MQTENQFGLELRRRRLERGMSLQALAAAVPCSRSYLSRVERGERHPTPLLARLFDAAVAAEGQLIALARDTTRSRAVTRNDYGVTVATTGLVQAFMATANAAAAFAADRDHTVEGARNVFDALRQQGHSVSPVSLLPALAAQFGVLQSAAGSANGSTRQRLLLLAAHYAEYAGWMVQEAGDGPGALALTKTAAELADLAGDRTLAVYALLRRADIALYRHDGRAVVEWAGHVESKDVSLRVRALAAQRVAQGWAVLGEKSHCMSALARAADIAAAADDSATDSGIALGPRGGGRLMEIVRGWCYLDLGSPDKAAHALEAGMSRVPPAARRTRALYGVRLALSHAAGGDVRMAYESGMAALEEARYVDSASVRQQLGLLAVTVRRWPKNVRLSDFQIRIDQELTAGRSRHRTPA